MEHIAYYRKYRPRSFDDVYGQDHITSVLKYESAHSHLSHAYLFCGPRGTGKTTCAKILAKAANCLSPVDGDPCGVCDACRAIDNGSATDVLEMDAASNNGVDYIRDIRDEVSYSPAMLKKRVYIIDEVHMLSTGAFNALLKTLEEPPEHVIFILATTEQHKLPATIISRCQRFDFRRIALGALRDRLLYIAEKENILLARDAAELIAKQAQGGMRDAVNLLELCSGGGKDVDIERVRETLGISGIEINCKVAEAVKNHDIGGLFSVVSDVASSSKDISVFWQELISFWRDMLVAKNLSEPEKYLDMTPSDGELLRGAAAKFTTAELIYGAGLLDEALMTMSRMPQLKRTTAEMTLIKISTPSLETTADALVARITALENKIRLSDAPGATAANASAVKDSGTDEASRAENSTSDVEKRESKNGAADTENGNALPSTEKETADPVASDSSDASGAVRYSRKSSAPTNVKAETPSDNADSSSGEDICDGFILLEDRGELREKLIEIDSALNGFIEGADLYVNGDGTKIKIVFSSAFGVSMMTGDKPKKNFADAAVLAGITDSAPEIICEVGSVKRKKEPINDLEEV